MNDRKAKQQTTNASKIKKVNGWNRVNYDNWQLSCEPKLELEKPTKWQNNCNLLQFIQFIVIPSTIFFNMVISKPNEALVL